MPMLVHLGNTKLWTCVWGWDQFKHEYIQTHICIQVLTYASAGAPRRHGAPAHLAPHARAHAQLMRAHTAPAATAHRNVSDLLLPARAVSLSLGSAAVGEDAAPACSVAAFKAKQAALAANKTAPCIDELLYRPAAAGVRRGGGGGGVGGGGGAFGSGRGGRMAIAHKGPSQRGMGLSSFEALQALTFNQAPLPQKREART